MDVVLRKETVTNYDVPEKLSSSSDYAYITVYSLNKYVAETLEVVESMIKEPLFTLPERKIEQLPE